MQLIQHEHAMLIEDKSQNKINKLTEKLSTEGINSTTIKQIDV
ncbi:ATP-binding protein [Orientia tsutsugamushi]|uniref:ATP-binding protein n=1 Tax=Orientia tsutsugamushi TaxID=784 RepID=A0A2U3R7J8_ORITS|nr:hypothetical protein [Orientia tsutsugamushi]KJV71475.1 hypothetical protein OTSTA763_2339 [Orientia tsutsugamushi str. TA763]KJV80733.1 hypothetical protein OTSUT76_1932 [Orientia tsutsugamushi str. UT76]KJV51784.1 hypothetical protein OTSKARP_1432 [Orientia tsutsugamushi str. Karp]SPR07089.1 ATP-binding protein [Orientia tsutsugamushi]SPR09161.1 ATP-binding protein [Orientia tsutsugamushi]